MIERALSHIHTKLTSAESNRPNRGLRIINHKEAYKIHLEQQRFRDEVARHKYESEAHPPTTLQNPIEKMNLPEEIKAINMESEKHDIYP